MKNIGFIMLFIGFISLMTGIYISSHWITGAIMAIVGGGVMGGSTYFFVEIKKDNHS